MIWKRTEEGQNIKITLEKSNHLPATYGDRILGLWKLDESIGNEIYFDDTKQSKSAETLYLRWDKRFIINSNKGNVNGVFNVNGHKPEIKFIPYMDEINRNFCGIELNYKSIKLTLLNTDSLVIRKFIRINNFPSD